MMDRDIFCFAANNALVTVALKSLPSDRTPIFVIWGCLSPAPEVRIFTSMNFGFKSGRTGMIAASLFFLTFTDLKTIIANHALPRLQTRATPSCLVVAFTRAITSIKIAFCLIEFCFALGALFQYAIFRAVCGDPGKSFVPRNIARVFTVAGTILTITRSIKRYAAFWAYMKYFSHRYKYSIMWMEEKYCEIAAKRIERAEIDAAQNLFLEPEPIVPEKQMEMTL